MHQLETLSSFELVRSFEPDAVKYRFLDTDKQSDRIERDKKFQIDKDKKKSSFILRIIKDFFLEIVNSFFTLSLISIFQI